MLLSHKLKKQSSESLQAKRRNLKNRNPMGENPPRVAFVRVVFWVGVVVSFKTCLGDQIIKLGFVNAYLRSCVIYLGSFKVAFLGRCWDWLPFRHVFGSVSKPSKGGICWSLSSWVEFLIRKGSCWSVGKNHWGRKHPKLCHHQTCTIFVIKTSIGDVDKVHTNPWIFFVKNRFVGGMFPGSYGSDFWILDDPKDVQVGDPKLQCLILSKLSLLLTVPYSFFTKHNFFWKKSSCFLVTSTFGCLLPQVSRPHPQEADLSLASGKVWLFWWDVKMWRWWVPSTSGVKTHQVIQAVTFLSPSFGGHLSFERGIEPSSKRSQTRRIARHLFFILGAS